MKTFVVDVDFGQILVVDCRPNSKKVVESTKRWTPPFLARVMTSNETVVNFVSLYSRKVF